MYIEKYAKDVNMPSLPSMPAMPSMPKMPKKFTSALHWPLSNVQIKNLPIFLKKEAKDQNGLKKPNIDVQSRPLPARPPQPPPRSKRPVKVGPVTRPNVPPPAVPVSTLEIGEPTSVTINGVTVTKNEQPGVLVPASPAMADEDIPDSMQSVPPPPPTCPPPED